MAATDELMMLRERFGAKLLETCEFRGERTVRVTLDGLTGLLEACRKEFGYEMLIDVSSLDHFGRDPRFEVVYELAAVDDSKHLRVKAEVGEEEAVPSVTGIWPGADWHEREVWDMMGIPFTGHPNLKRILMWEGYPYHPLRKDFPLAGRPSEMPDVAFSGVAPLEGGPFVTCAGGEDTVRREPRARVVE
jgi:NADH-quinone oxidoreductase subunit C